MGGDGGLDVVEGLAEVGAALGDGPGILDLPGDDLKRVVELVGDARGDLAGDVELLHRREVVDEVERRADILIVTREQHVDDRHPPPQVGRLLATHVVGHSVRRHLHAVAEVVEVEVLLNR